MLQFGWPNVCSVWKSQIQNTFPHVMNNSTENNWSGQWNCAAKNRHHSEPRQLHHNCQIIVLRIILVCYSGHRVNSDFDYLCPRWKVWHRSFAPSQNLLLHFWVVGKVRLLHRHSASSSHHTGKCECVCVCVFWGDFFPLWVLCSSGFLISLWRVSWLVSCSLTDGGIRQGLEMATLIWGANPSPTPRDWCSNPRRQEREWRGWPPGPGIVWMKRDPDPSRTSGDHSRGSVIWWRDDGLVM